MGKTISDLKVEVNAFFEYWLLATPRSLRDQIPGFERPAGDAGGRRACCSRTADVAACCAGGRDTANDTRPGSRGTGTRCRQLPEARRT
jgi:hypothetical protein